MCIRSKTFLFLFIYGQIFVCTYVHMDKFVKRWAKVTNGRLGSDKG